MAEQNALMKVGENNIKELNSTQCDISQLLHMAYNATKKQPEIATRIRLTAHLARTQRVESSNLISRFALNAKHVQETLIPIILEGVELQETSIITAGLEQALCLATDMKTETEKAKANCQDIQTKVQGHIGEVAKTDKHIRDRNKEIIVEKEEANELAKQAEEDLKAQNEILERIQKEGEEKRKHRDRLQEDYDEKAADIRSREDEKVLDSALFPDTAIPAVKMVVQVTAGLVNLVGHGLNALRKNSAVNQAADQLNKAEDLIRDNERLEREYMMGTQEKKDQRIKQLHKFKKLCLEAETNGDVSGLVEASARLGEVDQLLLQLIGFWNTMVLCITCLINDTSAGKSYLGSIGKEAVQQRFCLAIEKAKKGWCEFERICRWYHDVCEGDTANSNRQLYDFLSKPIDNMSKEEVQAQQRAIADKLEADIEEAELGNA